MAATTRPKEVAGFIQICVYVVELGIGEGGSHTQARGWKEGLLQPLASWWYSALSDLRI